MKKERMALFFFSSTRCLLGQGAPALQRLHQLLIDLAIALVQLNGAGVVVGIQRAVGQGLANGFLLRLQRCNGLGQLIELALLLVAELALGLAVAAHRRRRSEERRVGKECRSRWSPY